MTSPALDSSPRLTASWLARKERGNESLLRFMVWVTLRLGRPVARLLLPPIVGYFVLFSPRARAASRTYLGRVLGRIPRWADLYRHYHTFAQTIMDRVYFLSGRYHYFDITVHGAEAVRELVARGRGCVLLGSHLGSFEALRAAGVNDGGLPVSMLMDTANAQRVTRIFTALDPTLAKAMINMGEPSSLLRAKERLEAGGLVGTLADRLRPGDDAVECMFFGRAMRFPEGPLLLAGVLQAPVVLCFGLYRGGRRYDIHFEAFSAGLELPRRDRSAALATLMQRYTDRLEHYCHSAPYNWFNFYDVWDASNTNS